MNKKLMMIFAFLLVLCLVRIHPETAKDKFLRNTFETFNKVIDTFATDYSRITGLYAGCGILNGSASIGSFPSFRFGATAGVIFLTNPVKFLKEINFYKTDYGVIKEQLSSIHLDTALNWFDNNFLPIPVANYHFRIGLPHGLSVGSSFNVGPLGALINGVAPASVKSYGIDILHWGIGADVNYTILREYKYLPSVSVGFGVSYSDVKFAVNSISMGNLNLDPSNDSIPSTVGFQTHSNNISFIIDLSVSKRFGFFQPFISLKFVQTVDHNITKFNVGLDLTSATSSAKSTYAEKIAISNANAAGVGAVIPVSDFVITTGFEFVMGIFRMGIAGSFSAASQTGMATLDMRFQVEDWQFDKMKKKPVK